MKLTTKGLTMLWALFLLGLWMPRSIFAGICAQYGYPLGYCCESHFECGYGECLPYSGICGISYDPCNVDADCPSGEICMNMGVCEDGTSPCLSEPYGMCFSGGEMCQSDANCTPPDYCVIQGSCSNDGTIMCAQDYYKACTDMSSLCASDADCTAPATCEVLKSCLQGPDTCSGMCFTDADCASWGGGTCTADPFCCEGTCGDLDWCGGGGACDPAKCEAPLACGICSDMSEYPFDSCSEHTDCASGAFCLSLGKCVGGIYDESFCTSSVLGFCAIGGMLTTPCRNDADCPEEGDYCVTIGSCSDDGTFCAQQYYAKACTDMSGLFCESDADCTAPATCEAVKSCLQGPDTCSGYCFTDADCVLFGGGTCTGDPWCCEASCGDYDWCPGGACLEPCTFDYTEPTTPEDHVVEVPDGTIITFATVTSPGETEVVKTLETPELYGNFYLLNEPAFVYDIETTAGTQGDITVCVKYDDPEPPMEETQIQLLHEEDGIFWNRTSSLDTENNIVCAVVSHLSHFVAGYLSGCTDEDGDGYNFEGSECGPIDCNYSNRNIYPTNSNSYCDCEDPIPQGTGTEKLCDDGIDNDCDGLIDSSEDPDCVPQCNWPGTCGADAEASIYGSPEGKRSKVFNNLAIVFIPACAVFLLRVLRRRR